MLAKRFFYVSAALFLLALTYHLGARGATAQGSSSPTVAAWFASTMSAYQLVAVDNSGQIWRMGAAGVWEEIDRLPGPPTSVTTGQRGDIAITMADGSICTSTAVSDDSGRVRYTFTCNPGPLGATSAQRSSWGAVKDRYRK